MRARSGFILCTAVLLHAQTVTTFAGNGMAGSSGDGAAASLAEINHVTGLAADASGNLYLADQNNNRVRKVDRNGVITTYAGTGAAGFSGDNGPAAHATLNAPTGVCAAPNGDIYVNDQGNFRVRKISGTSGVITTVAGSGSSVSSGDGGPAISAGLNLPTRCAVDSRGNLYIVDQGAHVIRKVDSSGNIMLFAGNYTQGFSGDGALATSAALNTPAAVSVDAAGNVFVTDQLNQRIRRVDTSGKIQTVAGNGNAAFTGDGGAAASAGLNYPGETVVDPAGSLYIADGANQRVRKVSAASIATIAGSGIAGFSGDGGPALQAQFSSPFAIAIDPTGNLYIGDTANNRIRRISAAVLPPGASFTAAGVTNAASFQSGIAPGGIVTIFGSNLGASAGQVVTVTGTQWPQQLNGTSVAIDGVAAPVYRVLNLNGQEQLSVQAPWSVAGKEAVSVEVTTTAGRSAAVSVPVLASQPGIFLLDAASSGATHADGTIVTAAHPATRGETVVLYLTGLGAVTDQPATGAPASTTGLSSALIFPTVTIGGASAYVSFAGLTPGYIGLYQINVQVPVGLASGLVGVTVQAGSVISNSAQIAVQ